MIEKIRFVLALPFWGIHFLAIGILLGSMSLCAFTMGITEFLIDLVSGAHFCAGKRVYGRQKGCLNCDYFAAREARLAREPFENEGEYEGDDFPTGA